MKALEKKTSDEAAGTIQMHIEASESLSNTLGDISGKFLIKQP